MWVTVVLVRFRVDVRFKCIESEVRKCDRFVSSYLEEFVCEGRKNRVLGRIRGFVYVCLCS